MESNELETPKASQDRTVWLDDHVHLMLTLFAQSKPLLGKTMEFKNKITMWHTISAKMREHGCTFTGEQVANKWKALKRLAREPKINKIIKQPEFAINNKEDSLGRDFCRVCQTWKDCEIDLLHPPKNKYNVDTYLDCYNYVLNSNIDLKAGKSHKLCGKCGKKLLIAYEFTLKANKVEQLKTDNNAIALLADPLQCELNFEDIFGLKQDYVKEIEEVEEKEINNEEQQAIKDDDEVEEEEQEEEENVLITSDMLWNKEVEESARECFNCLACENKWFGSLDEYLEHYELTHETEKYVCELCGKIFKLQSNLFKHMDTHNKPEEAEKVFQCEDCERSYKSQNAYNKHRRLHLGKTIPCKICNKKFTGQKELDRHLRFHTKDYPYMCEYCGKKFALSCHLIQHRMRHKNMRCECPECGKHFLVVRSLYQHYYKHTGEMPYPCCYCKRAYPTLTQYKTHLRNTHKIHPTEEEVQKSRMKCPFKKVQRPNFKWVQVSDTKEKEQTQILYETDESL